MIQVKEFFDKATWTMTYVVWDSFSRDAVIIDPVWDYDPAASQLTKVSYNLLRNFIESESLRPHYVIETHAHADHVTSSQLIKQDYPQVRVAISSGILDVQSVFRNIFGLGAEFAVDGSQFDYLVNDGDLLRAGSLQVRALATPGHTPACMSFIIGDRIFVGDSLFMPDSGTGRCDFPLGSAEILYHSIHERLYSLPDHFEVFTGHDYMPNNRPLRFHASLAEEKAQNIHLKSTTSREEFIAFRTTRDKTLSAPRLLLPSIQINMAAGHLPPTDAEGRSYLRIPIST